MGVREDFRIQRLTEVQRSNERFFYLVRANEGPTFEGGVCRGGHRITLVRKSSFEGWRDHFYIDLRQQEAGDSKNTGVQKTNCACFSTQENC